MRNALVRAAKSCLSRTAATLYWKPLLSSRHAREACFDSAPAGTFMVANGEETYLLSSNDRVIGKSLYTRNAFEFGKLRTALDLIGGAFVPDLLVDVGANIGVICIPAVKRGIFERAIAFEPEPLNYALLCSNVSINGLAGKIISRNIALSDNAGALEFELSSTNYGDHRVRLAGTSENGRKTIRVAAEQLDTALPDIEPQRTLLWMDTQGFEGHVLAGGMNVVRRRPPMVLEFWPDALRRNGSYAMFRDALCRTGYTAMHDLDRSWGSFPVSAESFDALGERLAKINKPTKFTDLLFV